MFNTPFSSTILKLKESQIKIANQKSQNSKHDRIRLRGSSEYAVEQNWNILCFMKSAQRQWPNFY